MMKELYAKAVHRQNLTAAEAESAIDELMSGNATLEMPGEGQGQGQGQGEGSGSVGPGAGSGGDQDGLD